MVETLRERGQPAENEQAINRLRPGRAEHWLRDHDASIFDDDDAAELLGCDRGETPRRIDSEALFTSLVEPQSGRRYWGDADG